MSVKTSHKTLDTNYRSLFFNVVHHSPDSTLVVDEAGIILYANPVSEQLFDKPVADLEGTDFGFPLVSGETVEIDLLNHQHRLCVVEMRVATVEWKGKNAWLATFRDITQQIELARDLRRSNRELDDFASVVAHEVKAPLRNLHIICGWLLDNHTDIKLEALEDIRMMRKTSSRMQKLVDDLLSYSQVSKHNTPMKSVPLQACVKEVMETLETQFFESDATITFENLPHVTCDVAQITRLFCHLIRNALTFCTQVPAISITSEETPSFYLLQVRDNGVGISDSRLADVLEPFNHLHATDRMDGVGIGLAICKKIMEYHNGEIWLESEPGQGTTVHLKFPKSV